MTLTRSPDCLMRPEDKAMKMLFPTIDDPTHNLFDEFFDMDKETDQFDNNDSNSDSLELQGLFPVTNAKSPTLIKVSRSPHESTPQPWRKGLWCLNQQPDSDLVVAKTRKSRQQDHRFVSPDRLVNNDSFAARSPTLPVKMNTKNVVTRPNAVDNENTKSFIQNNRTRHLPQSPSSKDRQSSLTYKMNYSEKWQQDFQNFHLQMPDNGIYLSGSHEIQPTQHEIALRQANARLVGWNATVSCMSRPMTKYHYPFHNGSRENASYPEMAAAKSSAAEASLDLSADRIGYLKCATYGSAGVDTGSAPIWVTESLHSSNSSDQSHGSQYSTESYQNAYATTSAKAWMRSMPTTDFQLSANDFEAKIAAPKPQRPAAHILRQQQEEYHHDSLGIHPIDTEGIGLAVPYHEHKEYPTDYHMNITPPPSEHVAAIYPPLPPYPSYTAADMSAFATHHRAYSSYRTPSPSISPQRRSASRGLGQRSPTRTDHPRSRRKSIHKSGPVKDTTQDESHRRSRSTSRPPRTPKTPKTPKTPTGAGFGQIGFVNFTPKDSAKLMADVAPSGSSKTRQRREQEAKERRKRLNEVALQAVRNAGGDVTVLERAIFV